jgi:1-acyl-sn-glycerol-3-phosphate acyltransferase
VGKRETGLVYIWAPILNLLVYLYTAVFGTIALASFLFDRRGHLHRLVSRFWCRLIVWTIGARVIVQGSEKIRPDGCYIFMANHASLLDLPALFGHLPSNCRVIAKKELFYVPLFGWNLWAAGHFPVDRSNPRKTARSLRLVIEGVRGGKSLLVFPEGTRSADGTLKGFKAGAFKIALRAGVPIVPISISGTHILLPKGSLAPRPGSVRVLIGDPIETHSFSQERLPELITAVRCAIAGGLDDTARLASREPSLTQQSARR